MVTRDKILVEREYDGERCGCECPQMYIDSFGDVRCKHFEEWIDGWTRCPACLSTPGVEVGE